MMIAIVIREQAMGQAIRVTMFLDTRATISSIRTAFTWTRAIFPRRTTWHLNHLDANIIIVLTLTQKAVELNG